MAPSRAGLVMIAAGLRTHTAVTVKLTADPLALSRNTGSVLDASEYGRLLSSMLVNLAILGGSGPPVDDRVDTNEVIQELHSLVGADNIAAGRFPGTLVLAHDAARTAYNLTEAHAVLVGRSFLPRATLAMHTIYSKARSLKHTAMQSAVTAGSSQGVANKSKTVNVNVCMTTIPQRLSHKKGFMAINESLESLLNEQDYADGRLTGYLTVPAGQSVREALDYPQRKVSELAGSFKGKLVILPLEEDWGPASRFVGCAKFLQNPDELVMAFDDDIAYEPYAITTLACAKKHQPENSWTGFGNKPFNTYFVGQAADGLVMTVADIRGIENRKAAIMGDCFVVDDLSISEYLATVKNRPVQQLQGLDDPAACNVVKMPRSASPHANPRKIYKTFCFNTSNVSFRCKPTLDSIDALRGDRTGRIVAMSKCRGVLAKLAPGGR